MTLAGFSLVLAAAFCHATWNFFVKKLNAGPELVWLFSVVGAGLYLPVAIAVILLDEPVFSMAAWLFLTGSAVLHLAYFLLLQQGYRVGDLSVVYPVARATGPLLSVLFAVLVLGEVISLQAAAGALAVVIGVLCLAGGRRPGGRRPIESLTFGLLVGALIGSYTVWDAYAVGTLLVPPLMLDYASVVGRTVVLAPLAMRRRAQVMDLWRDHRAAVLVIAVFNSLAYILVLYALTFTPVIYVAPLREVSVLITVVLGSVLLGEGDLRRRLKWAALILAGVAALASSQAG